MSARAAGAKSGASIKATAIRMLARREYGRAELGERLIAKGADRDEVTKTLDLLQRLGYLSDARFAHALVAQKTGRYGKRAITHALKQKQVAPDAAQDALATIAGNDELAEATALWQRKFGEPPKDERDKARQVRFLLARGYGLSTALKVLRYAGDKPDPSE